MVPGINGRETYERILTLHPGQKAIITSGFSKSEEVKMTLELGAGGFLKERLIDREEKREAFRFLAEKNLAAAKRAVRIIRESMELVADQPRVGRPAVFCVSQVLILPIGC